MKTEYEILHFTLSIWLLDYLSSNMYSRGISHTSRQRTNIQIKKWVHKFESPGLHIHSIFQDVLLVCLASIIIENYCKQWANEKQACMETLQWRWYLFTATHLHNWMCVFLACSNTVDITSLPSADKIQVKYQNFNHNFLRIRYYNFSFLIYKLQ